LPETRGAHRIAREDEEQDVDAKPCPNQRARNGQLQSQREQARRQAEAGGMLKPADAEWAFNGYRHCDGYAPEGDVFQLRERAAS
jgi:hypothetical protein